VFPVNPALKEILGKPCYPTLDAAQAAALEQTGSGIDLVDVFRASEFVPPIVDDVIRLKIPYLWLQDEVIHDEAIARARAAGVKCIQNDCIFREHAKRPHLHRVR
jgi:predicted CoA-binding protein